MCLDHNEGDDPRNQFEDCVVWTPQPLLSIVFKVSSSNYDGNTLSQCPCQPSLSCFNNGKLMQSGSVFHPSKTACHMVTGHTGITEQHQPQPGGKKGNNFPSSPHTSTASVSNGHGAENWSLQNLELPLYPLSASHTAVRSPAATDSRLSREPLPCHHRSLRPPEHPWAIFITRIKAIFTLYLSIIVISIYTIFGFHKRAQLSPHRPLLPPEPPKHFLFDNASHNLVTSPGCVISTPHVCDAAQKTTFLWSIIILWLNWDNKRLPLCGMWMFLNIICIFKGFNT